ncbi:MAG: ATP-binding cassette domain-containing protein [Coriobacteriia bacterium]|nr:ATP-binding cassette domain-containing protein [Coriobacteriia bacterium]
MHCDANAIEVTDLSFRYPDGTQALDSVSFLIEHGRRVALLGPNGAGKSTLISHLNGITLAQSGTVAIEDVPITDETVHEVRTRVGVVFQDPDNMLFMTNIGDDIAFGPLNMRLSADEVARRVDVVLEAMGISELRDKPGMHISYGQKKRAALAAVLAMEPAVLVLDEPTSNLDPRAKREMTDLVSGLDITLMIATHDMDLAWAMCDTALVLDEGRVVAHGPARQIMSDEDLMVSHGLEVPFAARKLV